MELILGLYNLEEDHSTIKEYARPERYLGADVGKKNIKMEKNLGSFFQFLREGCNHQFKQVPHHQGSVY